MKWVIANVIRVVGCAVVGLFCLMIPTVIELRAPTSSSDTMSRPKGSVPSQWLDEGVCSLAAMSIS